MEDSMPALTSRKEARDRIRRIFEAELDRMIPPDESVPLKGRKFRDWEDQVARMRQSLVPVVLEERAALETNAMVQGGGHCPFCQSDSVYLEKQTTSAEVISPDGPANIQRQHCRCRTCGGSFSPSEP
jgi:hypothetical protein